MRDLSAELQEKLGTKLREELGEFNDDALPLLMLVRGVVIRARELMASMAEISDDTLRAEANRRGLQLHSLEYSKAAGDVIRQCDKMHVQLKALEQQVRNLPKEVA